MAELVDDKALILEAYRDHPAQWVNDWVWTYDPRNAPQGLPSYLPFHLFPRQFEFIEWLHDHHKRRVHGLVDKSRDEGMTWCVSVYMLHQWLTVAGFAGGIGSAKQENVDKSDSPQTIFAKLREALYNLPPWMLPKGYNPNLHDSHMKLFNPANGASIVGQSGDNMARSGRYSFYFGDEWAHVPRAQKVKRAITEATSCFIRGSTPSGPAGDFAADRHSGAVDVFTLHWRDDPRKDEAWYAYKRDVEYATDPVGLAQEVDIDYYASEDGTFFPGKYIEAAVDAHLKLGWTVDDDDFRATGIDVADGGQDLNAAVDRTGFLVTAVDTWVGDNWRERAAKAVEHAESNASQLLTYDRDAVGAGLASKFEDWDNLPFEIVPIRGGGAATSATFDDDNNRARAGKRFRNLRGELHWSLYLRFYKTWATVNGLDVYPPDECISIPNDRQLIAEIAVVKRKDGANGKIGVESKQDMLTRGVKSPNMLDALVLAFSHVRPKRGGAAARTRPTVHDKVRRSPLTRTR